MHNKLKSRLIFKHSSTLRADVVSLHKQGHVFKAWLGPRLSKEFLDGYEFDKLIAVLQQYNTPFGRRAGCLVLYRIGTEAELRALLDQASEARPKIIANGEVANNAQEEIK